MSYTLYVVHTICRTHRLGIAYSYALSLATEEYIERYAASFSFKHPAKVANCTPVRGIPRSVRYIGYLYNNYIDHHLSTQLREATFVVIMLIYHILGINKER